MSKAVALLALAGVGVAFIALLIAIPLLMGGPWYALLVAAGVGVAAVALVAGGLWVVAQCLDAL